MSAARSKPGAVQRIHIGDTIVEELRNARLPSQPREYEFWFAYKSGRNAELRAAADEIRLKTGALTARDIEGLHASFLSPLRSAGRPDAIVARVEAKLRDLAGSLDSAISAAQTQRDALATETARLGGMQEPTRQDLLSAIDRLTLATTETRARFASLEPDIDTAARQLGTIRAQLSDVRAECQADPTTGLPTRATFDRTLRTELEAAAETRRPVSLMVCNLDYFTAFNENFGNHAGDELLRAIGMMIKARMRAGDMVTRYDGDEFAVILPRVRAGEAVGQAEQFRQALTTHVFVEHANGAGRVTASIGVADAIKGDTPEFLLRRAVNGLKVAKREGRNRVVEMSPDGPIWDIQRRM